MSKRVCESVCIIEYEEEMECRNEEEHEYMCAYR